MDRISNLPDELLGHIVFNLTTKEAVATCVLSKRWEEVWLNLPNLDFHIPSESLYDSPSVVLDIDYDFIDKILRRLKSPEIGRFRLFCRQRIPPGVVSRWICEAVRLKASEIDFNVDFMELPLSFFNCNSLTVLKLFSRECASVTIPEVCCFPNLKSIEFRVCNPPKELTKHLFRSCPKLEDLIIIGGQGYYDISCPLLRVLEITFRSAMNSGPTPKVFLNVPKIEHFHIDNSCFKDTMEYEVQGPLAPIEASITLQNCCMDYLDTEHNGNCAYILLNGISGARSLLLNIDTTYILSKYHNNNLPIFQNLTCLELEIPRSCGWTILFSMLENSPNLQVFSILKACAHYEFVHPFNIYDLEYFPEDFDWTEPHTPPNCLQSQLEKIRFTGFFWMECDMKVMKYLLDNARVLKEVAFIRYTTGVEGEEDFWAELLEYANVSSSSNCVVQFKEVEEVDWSEEV